MTTTLLEDFLSFVEDNSTEKLPEMLQCPFCDNENFSMTGLKYHLENECKTYRDMNSSRQSAIPGNGGYSGSDAKPPEEKL